MAISVWANAAVFGFAAALSVRLMLKRPDPTTRWACLTFVSIGTVAIASALLPETPRGGLAWEVTFKFFVILLMVFPWALLRFAGAASTRRLTILDRTSDVLLAFSIVATLVTNLATLKTGNFAWRLTYSSVLLGYLLFATLVAGAIIWRSSAKQPIFVRKRMRMLAVGSYVLAVSLLISFTKLGGDGPSAERNAQRALTFLCALFFLLALWSPAWLQRWVRSGSDVFLVDAVHRITSGEALDDTALVLAPIAEFCGSDMAAVVSSDGKVIAAIGCTAESAAAKMAEAPPLIDVPFSRGRIVVFLKQMWPFYDQTVETPIKSILDIFDLAQARRTADRHRHEVEVQRRVEESRLEQAAELERVNTELNQFVAVASHDLQAPIRNIRDFVDLLRQDLGADIGADALDDLHHIASSASRMQELIESLLSFTRISNEVHKKLEPVRLSEIVDAALRVLAKPLRDCGAVVAVSKDLPTVDADPATLIELFINLFENSIKYRADHRQLEISVDVQPHPQSYTISVTDNGEGIPPVFRERVFSMFTRLHSDDEISGSGIGLAICRKIIERHGGVIWIDGPASDTDAGFDHDAGSDTQGTTVSFTLPVASRPSKVPQARQLPSVSPTVTSN